MSQPRLKTALVGFGKIGHMYAADAAMARYYQYATHAQVLAEHPRFDWVAVVDPSADAREAARTQWGIASAAGDVHGLGAVADQIDVAVIATPPAGRAALLEGFPHLRAVIVEKPLGRSAEEGWEFLERCAARGVVVQVNLWRRADERFRELAAGKLFELVGAVQAVTAYYGNGLVNNGTHMVDFVRMLFGEIVAVERLGQAEPMVHGPIEGDDNPTCALSLDSGVTAVLQPVAFTHYRENGLTIWGERGRLDILNEGLTLLHFPLADNRAMTGEYEIASDRPVPIASTVGAALYRVYDNVVEALSSSAPSAALWSPGHSAIETSRIIDAIRVAPLTGERARIDRGAGGRGVVFVEDPGAVNWIAPLVRALTHVGTPPLVLSSGLATTMLRQQGHHPVAVADAPSAVARLATTRACWLVVGTSENPDSVAFDLIAAARRDGVPSMGVVDSGANAAFRFRGRTDDPLAHAPDQIFVGDEIVAGAFSAFGVAADRVVVVGRPHDDDVAEAAVRLEAEGRDVVRRRLLPPDASDRVVIVFVSEISTGLNPEQYRRAPDYTLEGRGGHDGRTEIVVDEVLDALDARVAAGVARPFLVLRRHPKETTADLRDHRPAFDYESWSDDPLALVFAADLVVGLSSQLLADAHNLGVPTLSVLPRADERLWLPEIRRGALPCVHTRVELRRVLDELLQRQRPTTVRERPAAGQAVGRMIAALNTAVREWGQRSVVTG